METVKHIHFGHFVRAKRVEKGWTVRKFAGLVGLTEVRIFQMQRMAEPGSYDSTMGRLANALGMSLEELDKAWRTTPVAPPRDRGRPKRPRLNPSKFALKRIAIWADVLKVSREEALDLLLERMPVVDEPELDANRPDPRTASTKAGGGTGKRIAAPRVARRAGGKEGERPR